MSNCNEFWQIRTLTTIPTNSKILRYLDRWRNFFLNRIESEGKSLTMSWENRFNRFVSAYWSSNPSRIELMIELDQFFRKNIDFSIDILGLRMRSIMRSKFLQKSLILISSVTKLFVTYYELTVDTSPRSSNLSPSWWLLHFFSQVFQLIWFLCWKICVGKKNWCWEKIFFLLRKKFLHSEEQFLQ